MGLLGNIIMKGVATAARNSTIKLVGSTAVDVIEAKSKSQPQKDDAVVKHGRLYIKPTRSSEDYLNENTLDVVQELLGVGFERVSLKAVKKLGERAVRKYGKICSISINGNKEFVGIKKVPSSSHIVIEYLDFKESVSPEIYANVKRLKTGIIYSIDDLEEKKKSSSTSSSFKRYCSYCGEPLFNENAKFCSACGKEI